MRFTLTITHWITELLKNLNESFETNFPRKRKCLSEQDSHKFVASA